MHIRNVTFSFEVTHPLQTAPTSTCSVSHIKPSENVHLSRIESLLLVCQRDKNEAHTLPLKSSKGWLKKVISSFANKVGRQ